MVLIDTNVLVYLLIEGDRTEAAQTLYASDPDWHSEAFVLVEFSNVLATYVRTQSLAPRLARKLLSDATSLPLLQQIPHDLALTTSIEFRISAYDARFIACARETGTQLVTEDARLRAAVPNWTISIADACELAGR